MRSIALALALVLPFALAVPAADALGLSLGTKEKTILGHAPGAGDAVAGLVRSLGGSVVAREPALNVVVTSGLTGTAMAALSTHSAIVYTEADGTTRLAGAQWNGAQWDGAQWNGAQWDGAEDPGAASQWGLTAANATAAWSAPGAARLCVVDSGVDLRHPDLAQNAANASLNAINGSAHAEDDAGHGTHVAGIAAAVRGNGIGVSGVADSLVMPVKALDASGHGSVSDLVAGMVWCANEGADVVLLALSIDGASRTVTRAIDYLASRDVVVVASAGNDGPCAGCVSSPANDPRVIAVAAVAPDGSPAPFSASGPQVALAAPGTGIASTFDDAGYASGSGTSQAAAFVAGAALALRDATPGMPAGEVRARLVSAARDLGPPGHDPATGAGMLDLGAALGRI